MRILPIALALIIATSLGARAQAPVGPGSVKLGKVAPEVVKTPEFQLSSGPTKRTGKSQSWLEIEVDYETKLDKIEELTFKYTAQIEAKLYTGEVTYVNISKGREHFAVMYMSPKAIETIMNGKPLGATSVANVWVEVSKAGQKLDLVSFKQGNLPNGPQLTGLLLTKNQTPFAPLFYDRYEEIKSSR